MLKKINVHAKNIVVWKHKNERLKTGFSDRPKIARYPKYKRLSLIRYRVPSPCAEPAPLPCRRAAPLTNDLLLCPRLSNLIAPSADANWPSLIVRHEVSDIASDFIKFHRSVPSSSLYCRQTNCFVHANSYYVKLNTIHLPYFRKIIA